MALNWYVDAEGKRFAVPDKVLVNPVYKVNHDDKWEEINNLMKQARHEIVNGGVAEEEEEDETQYI